MMVISILPLLFKINYFLFTSILCLPPLCLLTYLKYIHFHFHFHFYFGLTISFVLFRSTSALISSVETYPDGKQCTLLRVMYLERHLARPLSEHFSGQERETGFHNTKPQMTQAITPLDISCLPVAALQWAVDDLWL